MPEIVFPSALVALIGSLGIGVVLLALRGRFDQISRPRQDAVAVQASHVGEILRLGGVGVIAGLLLGALLLASFSNGAFTILLLVATVPVFLAGLAEDLGYFVSPAGRFAAALVSASLAVWLLGIWIQDPEVPGLDLLFSIAPIAIALTVLFAGFYCHSVNLIDGMNGLSSVVVISSALGIAIVALGADLNQISALAFLLAAAMFGFFVLNWPKGLLLLGDAGAYGVGHLLVWLAIALAELSATHTAAILLILFWPLADSLHTILRRLLGGKSVLQPDRMHLHQKIRRGLEITFSAVRDRKVSNPLTTALMAPMVTLPVVAGVILRENALLSWLALLVFALLFSLSHLVVPVLVRMLRPQSREGNDAE